MGQIGTFMIPNKSAPHFARLIEAGFGLFGQVQLCTLITVIYRWLESY